MLDNTIALLQEKVTQLQLCIQEERLDNALEIDKSITKHLKTIFSEELVTRQSDFDQLNDIVNCYEQLLVGLIEQQNSTRNELVKHAQNNKKVLIYKQFR